MKTTVTRIYGKWGNFLKKTVKWILVICCLCGLAGFLAFSGWQQSRQLFGARLAGQSQIERITQTAALTADECALYWNGVELAYNRELGAYCLPQPLEGEPTGTLSAQWGSIYLPDWLWQEDGAEAIASGSPQAVYVSDGKQWKKLYVYRSGMPVIAIDSQVRVSTPRDRDVVGYTMGRLPVENNYGSIRVFWPEGNLRQQVVSTGVEWHWRGNASYFADKKSYRLNLLDENGNPDAQDLLGLGSDADWILLNLATDVTRVRDKVANDLWNQMSATWEFDPAGAVCEFVELYLNDEYMGVYLLCTNIDRELLDLQGGDRLYKYRQATMIQDEDFDQLEQEQSLEWLNKLEVVWPKLWTEGVWQEMRDYVTAFYRPESHPEAEELEQMVNVDNLIDVALFKQFTCAIDNSYQNQYYLYRSDEGKTYRIPWDLNYTFGDTHDGLFELDFSTLVVPDMELNKLYEADSEGTAERVASRWAELRETVFDWDAVYEAMENEIDYLVRSGAMGRDWDLWGAEGAYASGLSAHRTLDLDETDQLMEKRLEYLDEYMADYRPERVEAFGLPE